MVGGQEKKEDFPWLSLLVFLEFVLRACVIY